MSSWNQDRAFFALCAVNFFLLILSAGIYGVFNPQKKERSFNRDEVEQLRRCFSALEGKE